MGFIAQVVTLILFVAFVLVLGTGPTVHHEYVSGLILAAVILAVFRHAGMVNSRSLFIGLQIFVPCAVAAIGIGAHMPAFTLLGLGILAIYSLAWLRLRLDVLVFARNRSNS